MVAALPLNCFVKSLHIIMQVRDEINTANIQCVEADMDGSDTSDTSDASDIMMASGADGVYFWNKRFGYMPNAGYRMNPHERRRFKIRRRHVSEEIEHGLFWRDIQIAADGSLLRDGDEVYLLDAPFHVRRDRIDYFHHMSGDSPTAQLCADEVDVDAIDMVPRLRGNTVKRITVLQRMWGNILWRRHSQPELIQLAYDVVMRAHS